MKRFRSLFGKVDGLGSGLDINRPVIPGPAVPGRSFSYLENSKYSDQTWVASSPLTQNYQVEGTTADSKAEEEPIYFPHRRWLLPASSTKSITEEAERDLYLYYSGSHPGINGPWPWDNIQKFRDVLDACVISGMAACDIGQFVETMCHRKDKPLDGLVTTMVNNQYAYSDIGRTVLQCFGRRDDMNIPVYQSVQKGNVDLRPDPPARRYVNKLIPPADRRERHKSPLCTPEVKVRFLKRGNPLTQFENITDLESNTSGQVVADGLRLKRLPTTQGKGGRISNSLVPRRAIGLEGKAKLITLPKRAKKQSADMNDKRTLEGNHKDSEGQHTSLTQNEDRSVWDDDTDDENSGWRLPRSLSLRQNKRSSYIRAGKDVASPPITDLSDSRVFCPF